MENVGCSTLNQEKHIELSESIDYMETVIDRVQGLRNRINGEEFPETSKCVATKPTLESVLANSASEVRGKCERLHKLVDEVESLLF